MNILLLLSALFSAITGVTVGGTRAEAPTQIARAASVAAAVVTAPAVRHRPLARLDRLAAIRWAVPLLRLSVFALPPYTLRRRE